MRGLETLYQGVKLRLIQAPMANYAVILDADCCTDNGHVQGEAFRLRGARRICGSNLMMTT